MDEGRRRFGNFKKKRAFFLYCAQLALPLRDLLIMYSRFRRFLSGNLMYVSKKKKDECN